MACDIDGIVYLSKNIFLHCPVVDTHKQPQDIPKLTRQINIDHINIYSGLGIEPGTSKWQTRIVTVRPRR